MLASRQRPCAASLPAQRPAGRQAPRLAPSGSAAQPARRPCARTRAAASTEELETVTLDSDSGAASSARLVGFEDGTYTVEGSIHTQASVEAVWRVLTDYEALADVFGNIKSSRVVSRQPQVVLHQDCVWEFLVFSGSFGAELAVSEDGWSRCLDFTLVKSSFMHSFVGRWRVDPAPGGGAAVSHRLSVAPTLSPPAPLRGYTQKIFTRQVACILQDLERELQRRQAAS